MAYEPISNRPNNDSGAPPEVVKGVTRMYVPGTIIVGRALSVQSYAETGLKFLGSTFKCSGSASGTSILHIGEQPRPFMMSEFLRI